MKFFLFKKRKRDFINQCLFEAYYIIENSRKIIHAFVYIFMYVRYVQNQNF